MKRQYLGDSRDSFKWEYHDELVRAIGYHHLQVVWMMTPDDGGTDGSSNPERFPASGAFIDFCKSLKLSKQPSAIQMLPGAAAKKYAVVSYKPDEHFTRLRRRSYFLEVAILPKQVVFLDPDNGFEPAKCTEKHVKFGEIGILLDRLPAETVVTVFQHHRRKKFPQDFCEIRQKLPECHSTAIYWHSLMFVALSRSDETLRNVRAFNAQYAARKQIEVIA